MLSLDLILFPPGSILFLMVLAFVISLSINLINKKQIDYNRMEELQKIINE